MCMAIDAAMMMVNKSVDFARDKNDPRYYLDFMKLHKLLYLAQCCMLARSNKPLFKETITAHMCGPYIEGISAIPAKCGFGAIKERLDERQFWPVSSGNREIIELVLEQFCDMSTEALTDMTKKSTAYSRYANEVTEINKPRISKAAMKQTGIELMDS